MKKIIAALTLNTISMLFVLLGAEDSFSPYTAYHDFQWLPKTVETKNAGSEVRNQYDFTVPIHGPWLTNPAFTSATISWITRVPCAAGVDIRKKGIVEFTRIWDVKYGQIDYSKDLHTLHLKDLEPGTEYEYRLVSEVDKHGGYYNQPIEGREINTFRTPSPDRNEYKVFMTADFHGGGRLALDPMIDIPKAEDSDFFFMLGDNVEDTLGENPRFFITFGFIDDIVRKFGRSKFTVAVRGNHDSNGPRQYEYGDYFPRPDGKTYFAFSQGPAMFIVLDTLWPAGSKTQNAQYEKYRQEQAQWIADLKKTDEWKKAVFRIVVGHIGTHGSQGAPWMENDFGEVLNDATDTGRIHLFLSGHEHTYTRIDPLSDTMKVTRVDTHYKRIEPKWNYTHVVLAQADSFTIQISKNRLVCKSNAWTKGPGELRDAFTITPDGKVRDDMKVVSFPQPPPKTKK